MFQQYKQNAFILFFLVLTVFCLGILAANAQICQPAANGLVSWYRAEGSGLDAQGVNHANLQNGTTFAPGRTGQGFKFDGVDDRVEIPDSASLKPPTLTIEAWVRFDSLFGATSGAAPAGFQYIINKKNNRQNDNFEGYALIKLSSHQFAFTMSNDNGAQTTVVDSTQTIEVNRLYHVAGTFDGSTARLYVDGRQVAELPHTLPLSYAPRPVFIGSSGEVNWDGRMSGVIDEARIYNRALSATEIAANRQNSAWIANCDAEADPSAAGDGPTDTDVTGWENETGEFTVVRYTPTSGNFPGVSDPGPPDRGAFFFTGGQADVSSASQIISLADDGARIDSGNQKYRLRGFLGGFADQSDNARLTATFRDAGGNALGSAVIGPVTIADRGGQTGLLGRETSGSVPAGTRSVEVVLLFTRVDGFYNNGYADNLSFTLIAPAPVPNNLVSWYGGDGDARDFTGANSPNAFNNQNFIVGKVGQAFRFAGPISYVKIDSAGIFRGQTEGTIETWVRPRAFPTGQFGNSAVWVESEEATTSTRFGIYYGAEGKIGAYSNFSQVNAISPSAIPQNEWTHVAATYKAGETVKLYVNGVLAATSPNTGGAFANAPSAFVGIGALASGFNDDFLLDGDVDEASVYTRTLAASEIQSIYHAGTSGKRRAVGTNAGAGVAVQLRDATATFANVTSVGETVQTPLETALLPPLPAGFAHTGLAYDISTTAVWSGNADLCFNLPALAGANFRNLRILHLENGVWTNRTTSVNAPQLCGRTTSLSPFVIAENLVPTVASVTVGGRVTAGKSGVFNARISLTDAAGATRSATTNQFGYYRFRDVRAGAVYTLSAESKRYVFEPSTKVLFVMDELSDADFTALEQ